MDARSGHSWRDMIRNQVEVTTRESNDRRDSGPPIRLSRIHFSADVHPFLVRAAQRRGISISGYIRRATMARVALDLGLDPISLFTLDSAIAPIGKGGGVADRDLDGEKYGRWEVSEGEPGADR